MTIEHRKGEKLEESRQFFNCRAVMWPGNRPV